MANVTVRMGSFAMACVSGVVWRPVAREATVNPKSPLACETDICVVVPSSGAGRGGWTVIVVIELRERQDRRRSCVPARGGGGTSRGTVRVRWWWSCRFQLRRRIERWSSGTRFGGLSRFRFRRHIVRWSGRTHFHDIINRRNGIT